MDKTKKKLLSLIAYALTAVLFVSLFVFADGNNFISKAAPANGTEITTRYQTLVKFGDSFSPAMNQTINVTYDGVGKPFGEYTNINAGSIVLYMQYFDEYTDLLVIDWDNTEDVSGEVELYLNNFISFKAIEEYSEPGLPERYGSDGYLSDYISESLDSDGKADLVFEVPASKRSLIAYKAERFNPTKDPISYTGRYQTIVKLSDGYQPAMNSTFDFTYLGFGVPFSRDHGINYADVFYYTDYYGEGSDLVIINWNNSSSDDTDVTILFEDMFNYKTIENVSSEGIPVINISDGYLSVPISAGIKDGKIEAKFTVPGLKASSIAYKAVRGGSDSEGEDSGDGDNSKDADDKNGSAGDSDDGKGKSGGGSKDSGSKSGGSGYSVFNPGDKLEAVINETKNDNKDNTEKDTVVISSGKTNERYVGTVVEFEGEEALTYDFLKKVEENPGYIIEYTVTYENVDYTVIITADNIDLNEDIKYYGPAYLISNFPLKDGSNNIKTHGKTYEIKIGDTLSKIASELGVSIDELAAKNNIKNKNLIIAGKKLEY